MRLLLELAITHILGRGRQTVVAVAGVALGVGFSIAMASLMQGGEDDFMVRSQAEFIEIVPVVPEGPDGQVDVMAVGLVDVHGVVEH